LGLGLALCLAAYLAVYLTGTAPVRALTRDPAPELGWLKREFHIGDAEYLRIAGLHAQYESDCAKRCQLIDAKNAELQAALLRAGSVTPEVRQKLAEAEALRAECQTAMLEHFAAVSRSMPPEQGRRYLAWVAQQTFPAHQAMPEMTGH
jgi:hypothetical protein